MKNKAYTLIELISVIVILSIVTVITVPKVIDIIGVSRLTAYNFSKKNIIKSAQLNYLADVSNSKVIEYTVDDLITNGYLKKDIKNPLTNEKYEDTKVLITNEDGVVSYDYIEGNTLYDIIMKLNDKDGVYKQGNDYIFKGIDAKNYISFDGKIYRILKIDLYRNIYLINDEINNAITRDKLNEFKTAYLNDNYLEKARENIKSIEILDYNDYKNSFLDNETYIINNSNVWMKNKNDYKVISNITNNIIERENANVRLVLKMKSSASLKGGNGTQLKPYEIEK